MFHYRKLFGKCLKTLQQIYLRKYSLLTMDECFKQSKQYLLGLLNLIFSISALLQIIPKIF